MKDYIFAVLLFALMNAFVIHLFVENDWKRSAMEKTTPFMVTKR